LTLLNPSSYRVQEEDGSGAAVGAGSGRQYQDDLGNLDSFLNDLDEKEAAKEAARKLARQQSRAAKEALRLAAEQEAAAAEAAANAPPPKPPTNPKVGRAPSLSSSLFSQLLALTHNPPSIPTSPTP
jgi:hypothetical protein